MSTKIRVPRVRFMAENEGGRRIGFLSSGRALFATAVLLGAQVGGADTLPYAADAVLVLDAQSGLSTNGLDVVGWNDLSSGEHSGTVNTAAKPQIVPKGLNGHDLVQFNGDASLALSGQVLSSQQFTVFALVTDESSSSSFREIFSNWGYDNQMSSVFFGTSGAATRIVRLTDQSRTSQALNNPAEFSILTGVYDGGGNGQTLQGGTLLSSVAVNADRRLDKAYYIGVQGELPEEYWVGKMAEVIVYNRALTSNECAEVRSYLAQHWGYAVPTVPYAGDAVLVLDAQSGPVTNGLDVVGWYDLSAGWHGGVTNTVATPKLVANGLNGHNVVQFNGDASLALSGQVLNSQQFTVFALVTDESVTGEHEIFSNWSYDNYITSVYFGTAGDTLRHIRLTDQSVTSQSLTAQAGFSILSGVYNGGGDGQSFQGATLLSSVAVSSNRVLATPYYIGVQGTYGGREYWVGKMAEVIVYNRALTGDECAEVRSYLAEHWAPSAPAVPESVNSLTNLLVWLDAADSAAFVPAVDPGYVQSWCDKSGHGNNASALSAVTMPVGNAATLNGLKLASFSTGGVADRLYNRTMAALGDSSRTVIFLSTPFTSENNDIVVGLGDTAFVENSGWGMTDTTVFGLVGANDITGLAPFGSRGSGVPQIMEVSYDNTLASGQISRRANGAVVTAGADRPNSGYATSGGYLVGDWSNLDRPFNGNVAEVMIFDRVINAAERIILENYLAAKWNPDAPVIALAPGSQRYEGYTVVNGNYDRDVWGIGRVNSANQVLSGRMAKGLSLSASSLSDDGWLLAGHKTATNSTVTAASALEPGVKERWARVWYFDTSDTNGSFTVTLTFDFSEGGVAPTSGPEYDLLYSKTDPFSFRSVSHALQAGGQVAFTLSSQQLKDGYYTLGRAIRGTMICIR